MTEVDVSAVLEEPRRSAAAHAVHQRRWWILAVLAISQLMVILDGTIVNIALPTAQHALAFSNSDRQWIVTAYSLAFGSLLLLGGRISDYIGRRNALVVGLVGFAGASALGAASMNFTMLVTARTIQGAFGALLAPAVLALLTTTFNDPAERGRAFAIYGAVAGAGGAIGLLLGGVLTSYASWRWTLLVNLFFAAVGVAGALAFMVSDRGVDHDPLDWPGVLTGTGGLFALVYGFSHADSTSWTDIYTLGSLALGVVLLTSFMAIQRHTRFPLLPLRVLVDRNRGGALAAMLVAGSGMFGVFLFLTYYLQVTLGYSAVMTGAAFLPMVAGLSVTAQLSNIVLLPKFGPRPLIPLGMVMAASGLFWLTGLGIHSSYVTDILPPLVTLGFGVGLIFAPGFNTATLGVANHDAGVASALVNTSQQIGGSIGTALLNTLAGAAATSYLVGKTPTKLNVELANVHSYTSAFSYSAWIFLGGAVVTGVLLRSGAPTIQDRSGPLVGH
ncbi:MAG TPA: MFS transporter [Acidimicrobiales bacterium]|nr:MFS transporter [Acidimicrobiales bacterium]